MKWDEEASVFRQKADDDERAMRILMDGGAPVSNIGFCAQQSVEKNLKALLAHRHVSFKRTHDLTFLLDMLADAGHAAPDEVAECRLLQLYAVEHRYALLLQDDPEPLDFVWAQACVQHVREWVASKMTGEVTA